MPAGRPTKLTPELIKKAETYLDTCVDTPVFNNSGSLAYTKVNLPKLVGLAIYLDIDDETVTLWAKGTTELHKKFSAVVKKIITEQHNRLLDNALGGTYNARFAGMIAAKHGYAEKVQTEHSGSVSLTDLFGKTKEE